MADVSVTINPAATISATIGDGASNVVTGVSVEGSSNKTLTIYRQGADPISTSFTDLQNSGEASVQNVVYATGDQTISGAKDFITRPTVDGVGVLLSGEAAAAETGYLTGYVSKTETGDFLTNSDTGNFYTNDNPSGYITGVDLSNYVTGDVVRPSETGNYSNIFYPLSENPSEYATTSELTGVSGFLEEDLDNKQVAILNLNSRVSTLESTSATTGYVTGVSGYLQGQINNIESQTGNFVTGDVVRPDATGSFLVASDLNSYQTVVGSTGISGHLQDQISAIDLSPLNDATGNLDGRVNTLESQTGSFVTGNIVRPDATGDFLTSNDLSPYQTIVASTGISGYLQGQINNIDLSSLNTATGNLDSRTTVLESQTGDFLTGETDPIFSSSIAFSIDAVLTGQWGSGYNESITGVGVAGSSSKTITLYQRNGGTLTANFTDLEGTGDGGSNYYLTGADFNASNGDLTLYVNDGSTVVQSLDGRYATGNVVRPDETGNFLVAADLGDYQTIEASTGISGYLQGQINGIDLTALENATGNLDSRVQALENETGNYLVVSDLAPYQTVENSTGISGYLQGQISNNNSDISSINSTSGAFLTTGAGDSRYVNVTGDTVNGNLTITGTTSGNNFALDPTGYIDFQYGIPAHKEGRVFYDTDSHTLCYFNDEANVTVNLGQEHIVRVSNGWTGTIFNGSVVYVSGSQGNRPAIYPASAQDSEFSDHDILGVATHDIVNQGYVTVNGLVNGLNTTGFTEGDTVYLSTQSGLFTSEAPVAPNHAIKIGLITRSHSNQGQLYVNIDQGTHLSNAHDVRITGVQDLDILRYNNNSGYWENQTLDLSPYQTVVSSTGISGYLQGQINAIDLSPLNTATGNLDGRVTILESQTGGFLTEETDPVFAASVAFSIDAALTGAWGSGYTNSITGVSVTGTSSKTITLYQLDGGTLTADFTDIEGTGGAATDYYLTGASFDSSNGDLTLYVNDGSTVVQSLDGRYVTGDVVRQDETGSFLVAADLAALETATGNLDTRVQAIESETGNYLIASDLSPYQTVENSTGISGYLQGQISNNDTEISTINSVSGAFLTTGAGDARYYPLSTNPSNYLVAADITDLTNTEYVTGISGYLQGQIDAVDLSALEAATGNLDTRLSVVENGTGIFITTGTSGHLQSQITANANDLITGIGVAGTDTKTITLYQNDGGTLSANFSDLQSTGGGAGGGGKILQVVSYSESGTASVSSSDYVPVFSGTITPSSSSSQILFHLNYNVGLSANGQSYSRILAYNADAATSGYVAIGATDGNRQEVTNSMFCSAAYVYPCSMSYIDSPNSTNEITYILLIKPDNPSRTTYLNRSGPDSDTVVYARTFTNIVLMEIDGS